MEFQKEQRNFYSLLLLVLKVGKPKLRHFFMKQWNAVEGHKPWTDCTQNGKDLMKIFSDYRPHEKDALESGNSSEWSLLLIIKVLLHSCPPLVTRKSLTKAVKYLQELYDEISRGSDTKFRLTTTDFGKKWNDACNALILFGATARDFRGVKKDVKRPWNQLHPLLNQVAVHDKGILDVVEKLRRARYAPQKPRYTGDIACSSRIESFSSGIGSSSSAVPQSSLQSLQSLRVQHKPDYAHQLRYTPECEWFSPESQTASWEHDQERFESQNLLSTEEANIAYTQGALDETARRTTKSKFIETFGLGLGRTHRFLIRGGSQHRYNLPESGIAFEVPPNAFKDTTYITYETFRGAFPPPSRKDLDEVLVSYVVVLESDISHSGEPLVITLTHSGADKALGYETVVKAFGIKHEWSWTELEEHKSDGPKHFISNGIQVQIKIPTTLAVVSRLITDRFEVTPDKRCVVRSSVSDDVTVEFPEGAVDKTVEGTMKLLLMPENMHDVKDACPILCIDGFAGVTFAKSVIVKMPRPSKSEYQTKGIRLLRLDEPLKNEWEDITDDVHIIGYKTYIEFHVKHFSCLWPWTSSKNIRLAATLFRHLRCPPQAVCFAAFKDNDEPLCRFPKLTLVCVANHKQYKTVSNMKGEGYTRLAVSTADRKMRPNDEAYTRIDGAAMETQRFFLRFLKNEVCRKELQIRDIRHEEQNQEKLVLNFFPNEEEDCDLLLCSLQINKGIIFPKVVEQVVEEEAQPLEGAVVNLPSEEGEDEDVRKLVLSLGDALNTVSATEVAELLPAYLNVDRVMSKDPPADVIKKCHKFCRILKKKGRKDIVKALRRELPSGMTGPLLDGDILIKNLDHATKLKLSRALTVTDKWRSFAEKINGITNIDINFYSERKDNPVLEILKNHCGNMTIDELYRLIVESGANAIADLL